MARTRVGIRDVAAAAGVSITTVSHALSGKRPVSRETRQRVLAAARRLEYRPSSAAVALRGGSSRILALTVTPIQGYGFHFTMMDYYRRFIDAATWAALARDYAVIVVPPADGRVWEHLYPAGAIVVDPRTGDLSVSSLRRRGVPLVTLGRDPSDPDPTCWVDNDNAAAITTILDHFADQGSQQVALLASPPVTSYSIDCLASYRSWCAMHGQEPIVVVIEHASEEAAVVATKRLAAQPAPPDALLGTVDCFGVGAMQAADQVGVRVPDDMLIATWSEREILRGTTPFITRITDFPEMAGTAAVEMLIGLVEGREPSPAVVLLPTELNIRPSSVRGG